jgi:N-hydroxyarylamine O-acetyltransferase
MASATQAVATDEWAVEQLDLGAYLRRIGYDGDLDVGGRSLAALHRAHVAAMPFENADIMLGRGVSVDLTAIQDKLVRRRRGGYCFEHGLLLAAALTQLGYEVDRLLARVGGPPSGRSHLVLRVRAGDQQWLADTGFGTGLLEPLSFGDSTPRDQYGWTYRLRPSGMLSWEFQEHQDGEWTTRYQFDDQRQYPSDILVANHFTATYPGSSFVRQLVVITKNPGGVHVLTGRRLSVARPGHPAEERHLSDSDLPAALTDLFGLELTAGELARLTSVTGGQQPAAR